MTGGKREKPSGFDLQYKELERLTGRMVKLDRYGLFTHKEETEWSPREGYKGPHTLKEIKHKVAVSGLTKEQITNENIGCCC